MVEENNLKKSVYWHCRRGMLELDILLKNFFDEQFDRLNGSEKDNFVSLLQQSDQLLFQWLVNQQPPSTEFTHIIEQIRQHN